MNNLITYLIGASGITTALIFISKFAIKWINDVSLEKYKNKLTQETIRYKSILDKDLERFKIKYSRLHIEQVEIIMKFYSKLIQAERSLENLINMSGSDSEQEYFEVAGQNSNDLFDFFDENEVIFNEESCIIINKLKSELNDVWKPLKRKKLIELYLGKAIEKSKIDFSKYDKVINGEMQVLKKELKEDFRKRLGIIEEKIGNNMH